MPKKEISDKEVVEMLVSQTDKKVLILVEGSKELREFNLQVDNQVREHPKFSANSNGKFRVTGKTIRLGTNEIIFGLKKDEPLFGKQFREQEVYYAKRSDRSNSK